MKTPDRRANESSSAYMNRLKKLGFTKSYQEKVSDKIKKKIIEPVIIIHGRNSAQHLQTVSNYENENF